MLMSGMGDVITWNLLGGYVEETKSTFNGTVCNIVDTDG